MIGVAAGVDELGRSNRFHLATEPEQAHGKEVVCESGVDAATEEGTLALLAGSFNLLFQFQWHAIGVLEHSHTGIDNILAGSQGGRDVGHVDFGVHAVWAKVGDGICVEGKGSGDVPSREEPDFLAADNVADIEAIFGRIGDADCAQEAAAADAAEDVVQRYEESASSGSDLMGF